MTTDRATSGKIKIVRVDASRTDIVFDASVEVREGESVEWDTLALTWKIVKKEDMA